MTVTEEEWGYGKGICRVGLDSCIASELAERGVIAVPGSAFGEHAREHIRISCATSESDIVRALERMRNLLV